ncbi:MAG: S9 family peptidase [Candidatus Methanomethylicia archaeon]
MKIMRPLKIEDYNRFTSVNDPQISPNGKYIAFVTLKPDQEGNTYNSKIWIINSETGEIELSTNGFTDTWPRWSPNGKYILFLSKRTIKEREPGNELWLLPIKGGEPRLIIKSKTGIIQPSWSPNGRYILYRSPVISGEIDSEARLIDRIPIWFDGIGFTHHIQIHLFQIEVNSGEINQLTHGEMNIIEAKYSNDGKKIAFAATTNYLEPRKQKLHIIDLENGETIRLDHPDMGIGPMAWCPCNERIYFKGNDYKRGYPTHEGIWMINISTGEIRNLTGKTGYQTNLSIYYDVRGPYQSPQPPIIEREELYFTLTKGGTHNIYKMNLKTEDIEGVVVGNFIIDNFQVKNGKIVYTKITENTPAEIYVMENGIERKLTNFNDEILKEVYLQTHEKFQFKASDGEIIEGWLIKPVNYVEGKKYPTIIFIHGGPKSTFGYSLMFEHQIFASNGYIVVYANIRGSGGYSEEFADIRRKYGERDYQDFMEMVDYITKTYPSIDEERIGITGISYGGYMTNWIITQTNKFKAAVSLNGISCWLAEFGTTDIGFHFVPDQIGGDWWTNREEWINKSPITHADKVQTPILIIHSMEDYRCYIDQALLFYTALKYLRKEAKLLLFTEGSHVFSRSGKPKNRVKRLKYMMEWFDKYLKSKDKGEKHENTRSNNE